MRMFASSLMVSVIMRVISDDDYDCCCHYHCHCHCHCHHHYYFYYYHPLLLLLVLLLLLRLLLLAVATATDATDRPYNNINSINQQQNYSVTAAATGTATGAQSRFFLLSYLHYRHLLACQCPAFHCLHVLIPRLG